MKIGVLILMIALCFAAGGVGGLATSTGLESWYGTLEKPSWNPPGWVFGPVWSTLYLMMAIAAWLVYRKSRGFVVVPFTLFGIQLALNALWSFVFFQWRNPGAAFAEIVVLWIAIVATIAAFFPRSNLAGWLLVPYLAWVTFAAVLNFTIWRLNG
jgi:tryptophan-rich sensory protein